MLRLLHFILSKRFKNYLLERFRYLTFKKVVNIAKVEWSLLQKKTRANGLPYEIIIDPTNICQLQCPLCSTGANLSNKKKGYMEFSTFQQILDEVGAYAMHLYLHNWGESLLHKDILEFIRYAKSKNMAVSLSSNLSYPLPEETVDELIGSGLDTFVVSIDGATRETYVKYRVGGDFDQVMSNLRLLIKRKKELNAKYPYIEWQFLKMKHNIHETVSAKKLAKEIGVDNIAFGTVVTPFGLNDPGLAKAWFPENEFHSRKRFDILNGDITGRCWWLWRATVFSWDGAVSPCCYVDENSAIFGNVLNEPFKDIWNGEAYQSARRIFTGGEPSMRVVCNKCGVKKKQ